LANLIGERQSRSIKSFEPKQLEPRLKTVLLVDDDVDTRLLTKVFLNNFGYEVEAASSGAEALEKFDPVVHDLVLTDNSMPGMSGGEMAHVIKLRSPATPIIMCTGRPPNDCSSINVVIKKPTYLLAIKDAIDKCFSLENSKPAN
jgi:CheY-like chemotaxis protein